MDREVVTGLSLVALVGGGFRCALVTWALRRGEAHPPERARKVALAFGAVAIAGLVGLAWIALGG